MTEDLGLNENHKIKFTYSLIAITILVFVDIFMDVAEGLSLKHLVATSLIEFLILAVTFSSMIYIWRKLKVEVSLKESAEKELNLTKVKADSWQKLSHNYVEEFQKQISSQFEDWHLSESEQKIASMILKGLSTKEMAESRSTSERTIRNQCLSIYQKSHCSGRNELWAFFFSRFF